MQMTDKDVVEMFADFFGLKVTGPYFRGDYKPVWQVQSSAKETVRNVISRMLPYFGNRRAYKALNVLDDIELQH